MSTNVLTNPSPALFDLLKYLSQAHPEIQFTITVQTQDTDTQGFKNRDVLSQPKTTYAKTINPDIQECPECHTRKYSKYFSKSGLCKKCNLTYQGLHKGPKEKQEIQRNREIIWGPETPG